LINTENSGLFFAEIMPGMTVTFLGAIATFAREVSLQDAQLRKKKLPGKVPGQLYKGDNHLKSFTGLQT